VEVWAVWEEINLETHWFLSTFIELIKTW